jgi:hypothetical protein
VYDERRCAFVYSHDAETLAATARQAPKLDMVFGHLSFGIHEVLGVEARYLTVLRDPVARVVSFYRHQARVPTAEFHGMVTDGMSLLEMLESEVCHELNNHMTRIIAGLPTTQEMVWERPLLMEAFANLDHFDLVGATESLERALLAMAGRLRWETTPELPLLNVDPEPRGRLDPATLNAIVRYNQLDIELYDTVFRQLRPRPSTLVG